MALIYSSFSQINENLLPGLVGEYTVLIDYFNSKKIKEKVDFKAAYGKPVYALTSDLIQHQKDLRLFHFSGHSDKDNLEFPEEDFGTNHVSQFFNTLNFAQPKLECIFLNGCTNEAIVHRLNNVPVVIGSRSPILNKDAIKFTGDFFKSLISGRKTYEEAFNQACSALPNASGRANIVRAVGGRKQTPTESILNDYFMVINNEKVAQRGFPVRRLTKSRILSSLMYLAVLLTIVFGTWTFLKGGEIKEQFDLIDGYKCPNFADDTKCNILVANFKKGADELIASGINENPELGQYLDGAFVNSFKELIPENKFSYLALPDTCGFEYLMTGFLSEDNTKISISLFPNDRISIQREKYTIGGLFELKDSIMSISDIHQDQFIISKVCVACAIKNSEMRTYADAQVRKLKNKPGNEKPYQHLNEEMSYVHLEQNDTIDAISSLREVASIDINDKALAAMEKQSGLEEEKRLFVDAYDTQSFYVAAIENRQNNPSNYEMLAPKRRYESARRKTLLSRANLVVDHPDELGMNNQQALNDFLYLRKLNNSNALFQNQIGILRKRIEEEKDKPDVAKLQIFDKEVRKITRAITTYKGKTYKSDENGIITIPCKDETCVGEKVTVKATRFLEEEVTIESIDKLQSVTLPWEPKSIVAKLKVVDKNRRAIIRATTIYQNKIYKSDRYGVITIPCEDETCIGKKVTVKATKFLDEEITIRDLNNVRRVILPWAPKPITEVPTEEDEEIINGKGEDEEPKLNEITIHVRNQDNKPVNAALVSVGEKRYETDRNGKTLIPCEKESCIGKIIIVKARNYKGHRETLEEKDGMMTITLKFAEQQVENNIELTGTVYNRQERRVADAVITYANKVVRTDKDGTFDLGGFNDGNLPAKVVLIKKKGYQPKEVRVKDLLKKRNVFLTVGDFGGAIERIYTLNGTVNDCGFNNTVQKYIYVGGGGTGKIDSKSSFSTEFYGWEGQKVNLSLPNKFLYIREGDFMLDKSVTIKKHFNIIDSEMPHYDVEGFITINGDPIIGANVMVKNDDIGAVTDLDGAFKLKLNSYLCKQLVVSIPGAKSKTIELRNYPKRRGKVVVKFDMK